MERARRRRAAAIPGAHRLEALVAFDDAMNELAQIDARKIRMAMAWLYRKLSGGAGDGR
jgi:hypothetical protein